ncbi:MAG: trypsin-like peptidase domain-containing protein [Sedimentisphaerales bacterium]|nr:trypsin-like peptidase domain-containing protein [Sedimentisphaerales bacterium]
MSLKKSNILTYMLALCALTASLFYIWYFRTTPYIDESDLWSQSFGPVVDRVINSVVALETQQVVGPSGLTVNNAGSGFIIDPDGYIVTNDHVIHGASRIHVTLPDKRQYIAQVVGSDSRSDVAVIKIDADNLEKITIASNTNDDLAPGQVVIAVGNPLGTGADGRPVTTFGHINRLNQSLRTDIDPRNDRYYDNLIQTTAITLPGSSGGPLVNEKGHAIGIITAMSSSPSADKQFGFAILLDNKMLEKIEQLKQGLETPHAFLGVYLAAHIDQHTQDRLDLNEISGALVISAMLGFPAQQAGLLPGDLIRYVDNERIYNREDLIAKIDKYQPDDIVSITLLRSDYGDTEKLTIPIKLSTRNIKDIKGLQHEESLDALSVWDLTVKPLTPWRKSIMNLDPDQSGVLVYAVEPDSPAAGAGLKTGSVLTAINGEPVENFRDFHDLAQKYQGQLPDLKVLPPVPILPE